MDVSQWISFFVESFAFVQRLATVPMIVSPPLLPAYIGIRDTCGFGGYLCWLGISRKNERTTSTPVLI